MSHSLWLLLLSCNLSSLIDSCFSRSSSFLAHIPSAEGGSLSVHYTGVLRQDLATLFGYTVIRQTGKLPVVTKRAARRIPFSMHLMVHVGGARTSTCCTLLPHADYRGGGCHEQTLHCSAPELQGAWSKRLQHTKALAGMGRLKS